MTDYDKMIELCQKNNIYYHEQKAYDENNNSHPCIWLKTGHVEFNDDKMITNVVCY